jgi:hypothetical protein
MVCPLELVLRFGDGGRRCLVLPLLAGAQKRVFELRHFENLHFVAGSPRLVGIRRGERMAEVAARRIWIALQDQNFQRPRLGTSGASPNL